MQKVSEKKKDSKFLDKSKENLSIEFQEARVEKIPNIEKQDEERRRLEKWKIGKKNFP